MGCIIMDGEEAGAGVSLPGAGLGLLAAVLVLDEAASSTALTSCDGGPPHPQQVFLVLGHRCTYYAGRCT